MKHLFLALLILFSTSLSAQFIGGLYSGTLVNDSTKKIQNYELALNEYKDKIWGYSYSTFVANDTFYYSIKKVKGSRESGNLLIEDEKMLMNNFPEAAAKKVKQTNTIRLANVDTLENIDGTWSTNQTRIYYSLKGSMVMKRTKDSSQSALVSHLKELDLIEEPVVKKVKVKTADVKVKAKVSTEKIKPAAPAVQPQATILAYNQRSTKALQSLEIDADSLLLSFYDNGVVDGDSISVYMDGQLIIPPSKLMGKAIKKMIYLNNKAEFRLLLVAENLGSIPPNTGLMIIHEGGTEHQLHFSADLEANAEVIIRKKKK
jgi:hypothetical protein